jgi:glycosyltransferase involved in cell wall biosynthesis
MKRFLWLKRVFALYFFNWDIVFIQRLFIAEFILKKLTKRSRLIFDFDDAIYLDSNNKSTYRKAENMVRFAQQVVISTPWLNSFCRKCGKDAEVIPTPVETDIIKPFKKDNAEMIVIGWIGSSWTTGYLKTIKPVLEQLGKEFDFEFLTVGAEAGYKIEGIRHKNFTWEFGIEAKVLPKIDIGIMPLPDNDYARAKGGYKLYLYMAAGIPCVASPVGVNNSIVKEGKNGFLAASESEWLDALRLLIQDSGLRKKMSETGRKQAVEFYDRKVCFSQLIEIINAPPTHKD